MKIQFDLSALKRTRWYEYGLRFFFWRLGNGSDWIYCQALRSRFWRIISSVSRDFPRQRYASGNTRDGKETASWIYRSGSRAESGCPRREGRRAWEYRARDVCCDALAIPAILECPSSSLYRLGDMVGSRPLTLAHLQNSISSEADTTLPGRCAGPVS